MTPTSGALEDRLRSVLAGKAAEVDRRPLPPFEREVVMTLDPVEPVPVRPGWRRWSAVAAAAAAAMVVVAVVLLAIPPTATPPAAEQPEPIGSSTSVPAEPEFDALVPIPAGCAGNWGVLLTQGADTLEVIGVSAAPVLTGTTRFEAPAGPVDLTRSGPASIAYLILADGSAVGFSSTTLSPGEIVAVTESVAVAAQSGGVEADWVAIPLPRGFRVENSACGVG